MESRLTILQPSIFGGYVSFREGKQTTTRWFKPWLLSPRLLYFTNNLWVRVTKHHPKKVTRIARKFFLKIESQTSTYFNVWKFGSTHPVLYGITGSPWRRSVEFHGFSLRFSLEQTTMGFLAGWVWKTADFYLRRWGKIAFRGLKRSNLAILRTWPFCDGENVTRSQRLSDLQRLGIKNFS